jgi:hypothetical protein
MGSAPAIETPDRINGTCAEKSHFSNERREDKRKGTGRCAVVGGDGGSGDTVAIESFLKAWVPRVVQAELLFIIGGVQPVTKAVRLPSFRNFVPEHALS